MIENPKRVGKNSMDVSNFHTQNFRASKYKIKALAMTYFQAGSIFTDLKIIFVTFGALTGIFSLPSAHINYQEDNKYSVSHLQQS